MSPSIDDPRRDPDKPESVNGEPKNRKILRHATYWTVSITVILGVAYALGERFLSPGVDWVASGVVGLIIWISMAIFHLYFYKFGIKEWGMRLIFFVFWIFIIYTVMSIIKRD